MIEAIVGEALKWVQNNTDQVGSMLKRAYDSVSSSFQNRTRSKKEVMCPHCGKRYEIDADVYERDCRGNSFECSCSQIIVCR